MRHFVMSKYLSKEDLYKDKAEYYQNLYEKSQYAIEELERALWSIETVEFVNGESVIYRSSVNEIARDRVKKATTLTSKEDKDENPNKA